MVTEDYVSFKIAKLLKEKGFDEICYLGYNKNGEYVPTSNRTNSQIIQPDFCFICCPTLQMAMKWLREIHKLSINIWYDKEEDTPDDEVWTSEIAVDRPSYILVGSFASYKEACETAIKYCLENLI